MIDLEIINIIIKSYKEVAIIDIEENNLELKHRTKSKHFISRIHKNLKDYFNSENLSIFSLGYPNEVFNRHEYLFDIQVCKINKFNPNVHKERNVYYIEEALIQIESEFKQDTSASAIDFSKLVCGKSKLKIMILPMSKSSKMCEDNYLKPLVSIARNISENLYIIFLPHPEKWCEQMNINNYEVYQYNKFIEGKWKSIDKRILNLLATI